MGPPPKEKLKGRRKPTKLKKKSVRHRTPGGRLFWQKLGPLIATPRTGVRDGWTRREVIAAHKAARPQAERFIKRLIEDNDDIDPRAEEILTELATIVTARRGDAAPEATQPEAFAYVPKDRISAGKVVLDFTKQKPTQKVDAKVRAEAWLEDLANEIEEDDQE